MEREEERWPDRLTGVGASMWAGQRALLPTPRQYREMYGRMKKQELMHAIPGLGENTYYCLQRHMKLAGKRAKRPAPEAPSAVPLPGGIAERLDDIDGKLAKLLNGNDSAQRLLRAMEGNEQLMGALGAHVASHVANDLAEAVAARLVTLLRLAPVGISREQDNGA